MKRIIVMSLLSLTALGIYAQDTYQNATVSEKDLNGTARYVGMGGAMEALGADISTIGSNPAGIGLFRSSQAALSFGIHSVTGDDVSFDNPSKTKPSFDQVGFVIAVPTNQSSYLNFGFNYHKSRNFNSVISAANRLNNASQNKLSFIKHDLGLWESNDNSYSQVDDLYDYVLNGVVDERGHMTEHFKCYYNADRFAMEQIEEGYVGDYDFNISGNINNRVYLGLTLGIQDVHYQSYSVYSENLLAADDRTSLGTVTLNDSRHISGTGYNLKAGIIFRPVETSPFRIGAYVHTPTWYKLTTSNYTTLYNGLDKQYGNYDRMTDEESLEYRFNTPWLFGVSLGHTVGKDFAVGATYEYSDYGTLNNRVIDGGYYDGFDGYYYDNSSADMAMNRNTKYSLKGVHTLKVGAEMKVTPQLAVRAGYNYVSPKYSSDGYRDCSIESQGVYYASRTDYINWKETNRVTAGVGFSQDNFFIDFAMNYSKTNGEYFPFMSFYANKGDEHMNNICEMTKVSNERLQCLLTLGIRF